MAAKFCSQCNEEFDETAVVCKFCGGPLERADEKQPSPSAALSGKSNANVYYIVAAVIVVAILAIILLNEM